MKKRAAHHRNRGPARPKASTAPANSPPLLVEIEKPIYGGSFLARAEGKTIFTPLALPGEQARVRIVEDKRGYAFAEPEELLIASPDRVTPLCPHFASCGGCDYQHADYHAQLAFKQSILRETLERAGVQPPAQIDTLAANPWAYRNRIRLAFDRDGNIGYRGRRSHSIVSIRECPIAAPVLVKAALAIAEYFKRILPHERLAEITLFCNADESALLVSATLAHPAKARVDDFACALAEQIPPLVAVEFVSEGMAGRQPHPAARWGATSLEYRAAGFDYRVDHGAFFQVNRWLVDALLDRVADRIEKGRSGHLAWDLFAGVGLFARRLAASFEQVVAVESAPPAIAALEANLNGTAASATQADALGFLTHTEETSSGAGIPDLIVVDPPRTGLGAEVTAALAATAAPAIVYVSCDPATLARDLKALVAAGYAIDRLTLVDLFPQTFHLETVVDLVRA